MPCYTGIDKDGNRYHICGKLGPHCASCSGVGEYLCDYPVGKNKTCDKVMCNQHANQIGPDLHYCDAHFKMWNEFESSGGVKNVLENVQPFPKNMR